MTIGRARLVLVALLVAWFVSPPSWRYQVPLWLPFVLALAVELEFVVGGLVRASRRPPAAGRAPQPADLEEFGWPGGEAPPDDEPEFWSSAPVPRRKASLARRLAISAAALAFVALVVWGVTVRRGWEGLDHATQAHVEHVLSLQAGRIAGHRVSVRCDSSGRHVGAVQETDGVAEVGGTVAWLTPSMCFRLHELVDGHDTQTFAPTGRAIAVLAHEAWHLQGVVDEGVANCYAFQSGVGVGTRLGLSPSRARALMRQQLATNASDSGGSPEYLVPRGCHDGGAYDLHPRSARFP